MPARPVPIITAAIAALAFSAPAAHAIPAMEPLTGSADSESRPVVVRTVEDGLAWGSAAAGAGGAAAVLLASAAGASALSRRRRVVGAPRSAERRPRL